MMAGEREEERVVHTKWNKWTAAYTGSPVQCSAEQHHDVWTLLEGHRFDVKVLESDYHLWKLEVWLGNVRELLSPDTLPPKHDLVELCRASEQQSGGSSYLNHSACADSRVDLLHLPVSATRTMESRTISDSPPRSLQRSVHESNHDQVMHAHVLSRLRRGSSQTFTPLSD